MSGTLAEFPSWEVGGVRGGSVHGESHLRDGGIPPPNKFE